MIRVNLLRNLGSTGAAAPAAGVGAAPSGLGLTLASDDVKKQAALKVAATLMLPALVYVFLYLQGSAQEAEVAKIRADAALVDVKRVGLGPTAPKVDKFQAEQKQLQKELSVMKVLSRNRLREVKALDAIQNLMPPRTWLTRIKIENGNVNLIGYSSSEEGHSELLKAIEGSVFSSLEPKSTSQEESPSGPLKKFEIEFKIGPAEKKEQL